MTDNLELEFAEPELKDSLLIYLRNRRYRTFKAKDLAKTFSTHYRMIQEAAKELRSKGFPVEGNTEGRTGGISYTDPQHYATWEKKAIERPLNWLKNLGYSVKIMDGKQSLELFPTVHQKPLP